MDKWQYGVVIDAGSSGSRVHVYRWLNSDEARTTDDSRKFQSLPALETKKDWTQKIKPGIDTFAYKVSDVGPQHLQDLIDHALEIVPAEQVADTPIFLLATAGMRLLQDLERHDLLSEVCSYIGQHTKFLLPDCSQHIQVIPGSTEGLYGWIATNYLLGGFDNASDHNHGKDHHTYGFLDMGGASAQIAFAPNSTETEKHSDDLKLLRLRNVNGSPSEHKVFVTTWLGFGVNKAHERYVEALAFAKGVVSDQLPDPCLPKGLTTNPEGDILKPDQIDAKKTPLVGTGDFEDCLNMTRPLLNKNKQCDEEPCLLDGVHVPAIDFDVNHFVGVSEYWHTTHEIFDMGHEDRNYNFAAYKKLVGDFCAQKWNKISKDVDNEKFGKGISQRDAADVCFKASWVINMLHTGIGIPMADTSDLPQLGEERGFLDPFQTVNKIEDTEVSWTLGKMLLYASSQIPPQKTNNMPVGFGTNIDHYIPLDWEYPGGSDNRNSHTPNATYVDDEVTQGSDSWRDTLFEGNTPRRVPGFLIFLVIVAIVGFLLCGKERRGRFFRRFRCCGGGRGGPGGRYGRRKGVHGPKIALNGQDDHLMESGMVNPDDFELGDVDEEAGGYSDEAVKTGMASGWETPRMRTPMAESFGESSAAGSSSAGAAGGGLGINAMQSSGILSRTESRERLSGADERGRRSRKASPTRLRSPLIGAVTEG